MRTAIGLLILALAVSVTVAKAAVQSENYALGEVIFGSSSTLATDKTGIPPAISGEGPSLTALTATSATIEWRTDKPSSSFVNYGTDTSIGRVVGVRDSVTSHKVVLTGLSEQTRYHYRVESQDVYGSLGVSTQYSFSTPAVTAFREVSVSQVAYTSALVRVVAGGLTEVTVRYSDTPSFGSSKQAVTTTQVVENNFPLTDLAPGTKYYLQIEGLDTAGQEVIFRGLTFSTVAEPELVSVEAVGVSANEGVLTVVTNTPTSLAVTYQSEKDAEPLTASDSQMTAGHTVSLKKLFGSSEYTISLTATDVGGKRVSREGVVARTESDTVAPEVSSPAVSIAKNGNVISVTARWEAQEPIRSALRLKSTVNPSDTIELPETLSFSTAAIMVANGLSPKTPYLLEAVSTDSSGNVTVKQVSLVTPSLRKSVLELITENLAKVIEPIGRLFDSL